MPTAPSGTPRAMLVRFECRTARVKDLAFHPTRSWILAALHTGCIQLWDFRMGTLLDRFEEHVGAVRGVDFHPTLPLFVSCGDDHLIKVWNYKLRRCWFTLAEHLDYIRSVQFHPEQPWIVSASDDQMIRIWNWQSRKTVTTLTGHNHFVMSARFHPSQELLVSASFDNTIRIWDLANLFKNKPSSAGGDGGIGMNVTQELFGADAVLKHIVEGHERGVNWAEFHPSKPYIVSASDDFTIRLWRFEDKSRAPYQLDEWGGHTQSVTRVSYFKDLVVSCSEDRSVRVQDPRNRAVTSLYRREKDRFWALTVKESSNMMAAGHDSGFVVFKLARERPIFAWSQGKERSLLWVRQQDATLRTYDLATRMERFIMYTYPKGTIPKELTWNAADNVALLVHEPRPGVTQVDLCHPSLHTTTTLQPVEVDGKPAPRAAAGASDAERAEAEGGAWGMPLGAVLFASKKIAYFTATSDAIYIRNEEALLRTLTPPIKRIKGLHPAPNGSLYVRLEDRVVLIDTMAGAIMGEVAAPEVRRIVVSPDRQYVALLGVHTITICSANLRTLITEAHESRRVKSGAFGRGSTFFYSTQLLVKYVLFNGDQGVIASLIVPVYLIHSDGESLWGFDRDGTLWMTDDIGGLQMRFQSALHAGNYREVLSLMKGARFPGAAMVAYLERKGYPDAAMYFVKQPEVRFSLALKCGFLEQARATISALPESVHSAAWGMLGAAAMRVAQLDVAVDAYGRAGDAPRRRFLLLASGQLDEVRDSLGFEVAEEADQDDQEAAAGAVAAPRMRLTAAAAATRARVDLSSRVSYAAMLGAWGEVSDALAAGEMHPLAYLAAVRHGAADRIAAARERWVAAVAQRVADAANQWPVGDAHVAAAETEVAQRAAELDARAVRAAAVAPVSATPVAEGWPLLPGKETVFTRFLQAQQRGGGGIADDVEADGAAAGGWGNDGLDDLADLDDDGGDGAADAKHKGGRGGDAVDDGLGGDAEGWGDLDDLDDLPNVGGDVGGAGSAGSAGAAAGGAATAAVVAGVAPPRAWTNSTQLAGDLAAAGSFAQALDLLRTQVGVRAAAPLRSVAIATAQQCVGWLPGLAHVPVQPIFFERRPEDAAQASAVSRTLRLPAQPPALERLTAAVQGVYRLMREAKFQPARDAAVEAVRSAAFAVTTDKEKSREYWAAFQSAREYASALTVQVALKSEENVERQVELSAYFTHFKLQQSHVINALRQAMVAAYRAKCYKRAGVFAQQLLDSMPDADTATKARQVIARADKEGPDTVAVDYDDRNPFVLCMASLKPIYRGSDSTRCPFCLAYYHPSKKGTTCVVCEVGSVGLNGTGLVTCFQ